MHEIIRMDVVPDLLSLVAVNRVRTARDRAPHQVRKKTVQFRAGMRGAGKAPSAKDARAHAEIAAILLNHDVGGNFADAKNTVLGLIDAHRFIDSVLAPAMLGRKLPTPLHFNERQKVRRVAIDFIGRREDEHGLGRMLARGFEKDERPVRIDGEIGDRFPGCPIVARLGRAMDHKCDLSAIPPEKIIDGGLVSDVDALVAVAWERRLQPPRVPVGGSLLAEKVRAHAVVDTDDIESLIVQKGRRLAANKPRRTGDDRNAHDFILRQSRSQAPTRSRESTPGHQPRSAADHGAATTAINSKHSRGQ